MRSSIDERAGGQPQAPVLLWKAESRVMSGRSSAGEALDQVLRINHVVAVHQHQAFGYFAGADFRLDNQTQCCNATLPGQSVEIPSARRGLTVRRMLATVWFPAA